MNNELYIDFDINFNIHLSATIPIELTSSMMLRGCNGQSMNLNHHHSDHEVSMVRTKFAAHCTQ
jgi:hypothetical protein